MGVVSTADTRQAVVEAASAVEISLRRHLEDELASIEPALRKKLLHRATLGRLVNLSGVSESVVNVQDGFVNLRNDVMHRGRTPSRAEMTSAIQIAEEVVSLFSNR